MGNKQGKDKKTKDPADTQATATGSSSAAGISTVQPNGNQTQQPKQEQKNQKKKYDRVRKKRPMSYPPAVEHQQQPAEHPKDPQNVSANATGGAPEPGHYIYDELTDNTGEQMKTNTGEQMSSYYKALQDVLQFWPEYKTLYEIKVHEMPFKVVDIIQQVYKRLCELQTYMKSLSEEKHRMEQDVINLRQEREGLIWQLQQKDSAMDNLKHEIGQMKRTDSLRRYPDNQPTRSDNRLSKADYHNYPDPPIYDDTGNVDQGTYADTLTEPPRAKDPNIYKATPFVKALGPDGNRGPVTRTPSLLHHGVDSGVSSVTMKSPSTLDSHVELEERIKDLEEELAKEKRNNEALMRSKDNAMAKGTTKMTKKGMNIRQLADKYTELRDMALSDVMRSFDKDLGHVDIRRRYMFLCAVMEKSFEVAAKTVHQLLEALQTMLVNPLAWKQQNSPAESPRTPRDNNPNPGRSKLAARTVSAGIPEIVMSQIMIFLESSTERTNIKPLIEDVVDALSKDFAECTTPALLKQSTFSRLLEDCCRLSWQLNVTVPPMYLSAASPMRFDNKYHLNDSNLNPKVNPNIDFYLWPVLYIRKHGDVLRKANVRLR